MKVDEKELPRLLLEWADDFEAAARDTPRGVKRMVLATRAEECRVMSQSLAAYEAARSAEPVAEFMGMKVLVNPQLPPDAAYVESRRADGSVDRARVDLAHPTPEAPDV